jgi:hypothetical protein
MRKTLLATAILVNALALGSTAGHADDTLTNSTPTLSPTVWQAPIGHLQPRSQPVPANPQAEQAQQQQMSNYDAEQQKLDEQLDKRLNICRGC